MYDFLIQNIPSLLLLKEEDVIRLVLFVIVFGYGSYGVYRISKWIREVIKDRLESGVFSLHRNQEEKGERQEEEREKKRLARMFSWGRALFVSSLLVSFIGAFVLSHSVYQQYGREDSGPVFVGQYLENDEVSGQVLGEEDTFSLLPSGEKYRLGQVSVGGDTEVFIMREDDIPLEIYNILYRVMTEDSGEQTNVLIEWKTNKLARGSVFYRKHSEEDFRSRETQEFNKEHVILLENLQPETTYVFYIDSRDKWGINGESEQYAMYSGEQIASLFDLLEEAVRDAFGWAVR